MLHSKLSQSSTFVCFSNRQRWQKQIYQQAKRWHLDSNRMLSIKQNHCVWGRDRIPEIFIFTGWIFFSRWPPGCLPFLAPTGREVWTDTIIFVSGGWKLNGRKKRKERGKRERWGREAAMLLWCALVDDKPVSKLHTGFPYQVRQTSLALPGFYCHTCFYSEGPNVPLRVSFCKNIVKIKRYITLLSY